jgi:hypothetical protein
LVEFHSWNNLICLLKGLLTSLYKLEYDFKYN